MMLEITPSNKGMGKILKPWQLLSLRHIWNSWNSIQEPIGTGVVHVAVKEILGKETLPSGKKKSISRASVINFLKSMVPAGVLGVEYETCKGGSRGLYRPIVDEKGFVEKVVRETIISFMHDFPEETAKAIDEVFDTGLGVSTEL